MNKYTGATYYDCRDSEELSHKTPEEAIEDFLEVFMTRDCDVPAVIRTHCPSIKVFAYERMKLDAGWTKRQARRVLESVAESFSEEHGNPGEPDDDGFSEAVFKKYVPMMDKVLKDFMKNARVWGCEKCDEHTYTAAQVQKMMRTHRPDWFRMTKKGKR